MHVLIVDDDADIRRSLGQTLEETGHQVSIEADAERALQRAAAGDYGRFCAMFGCPASTA